MTKLRNQSGILFTTLLGLAPILFLVCNLSGLGAHLTAKDLAGMKLIFVLYVLACIALLVLHLTSDEAGKDSAIATATPVSVLFVFLSGIVLTGDWFPVYPLSLVLLICALIYAFRNRRGLASIGLLALVLVSALVALVFSLA